jgi:3-deoxy-D-manno-octulosonate 8-phosphate phosphatase (KDO 8-P phosphatase)
METAKKIRLLAMDVDGVLTNGQIILGNNNQELKAFNVKDGMGIALANKAGLKTILITSRSSEAVRRRAEELRISYYLQGSVDKRDSLMRFLLELHLSPEEVAYVGDDLNDLPPMGIVGLPVAVGDAVDEVKSAALYCCHAPGGGGAVREVVELILKAQGRWEALVEHMRSSTEVVQ